MNIYEGFESLSVTLNTEQGEITGSFLGYDENLASHIMNINGEAVPVLATSIIGLISTESFTYIDEANHSTFNVNLLEPGATGNIHFRSAQVTSSAQQKSSKNTEVYKDWNTLESALKMSMKPSR
ncbi:hypothetical protein C1Y08_05685 [Pseudomonas sp. FW306-02-F02-AA]|uniref:Uncharacterized protein n=1 Tax=Pseudomonas fluorescens TaxID=294 RepID=A0A0N9W3S8_PSEFL|nr:MULTISPECIES: hypothetical protein [Pseudomonas]ALI00981.1 hypothetical protein AO353_07915 [Pseudomonas fluorescens]PMZ02529.1 hypothetical protein C1Y07_19125 [Pseudomonas sp. FW306-02-F02-AB]PMZ09994.1 hypothetical protein C1Y06_11855 [Pseudomonas sp. FW306-02-H06C]PMZ16699.1 hypothetical protein C1Y08_05685 [Pseudomonas sp. FW306-02-F02-AA]PMZ23628.1 hypothetical protein C1Y09_02260 [Pseudomonas sp. FW306-02-F08-AA]